MLADAQRIGAAVDPDWTPGVRVFWRIDGLGETSYVLRGADLRAGETAEEPRFLGPALERWIADPVANRVLREIYGELSGRFLVRLSEDELKRQVKARLEEAFRARELVVLRWPRRFEVSADLEVIESAPARTKREREEKTWIEIELVDQDGSPVPGARYKLRVTDGSVREGRLDGEGKARVSGIDPGTCTVWFPDFDGREWRKL